MVTSSGPDGASTLCSKCGALFRHGYLSKPKVNEKGFYECPMCSDTFQSLRGLSGHRRYGSLLPSPYRPVPMYSTV